MRVLPLEPYLLTLHPSVRNRVVSSLSSTDVGRPKDLVTPLIGRHSQSYDTKREYYRDRLLSAVLPSGYSWLDEAERDQSEKIGSYSIQLPYSERREQVTSYFEKRKFNADQSALDYAFEQVTRIMPRNLKPVSVETAYLNMPKGTNLGAPFFTNESVYRKAVLRLAQEVVSSGYTSYRADDHCMLYWRGQPKGIGSDPKQRTVWGYPHWLTVLELMIQMALLDRLKYLPEFSAWFSNERVADTITSMLSTASGIPLLSVDFSGFDASVSEILIHMAFDVIRYCFHPSAHKLIDLIEERFLNIGLITPEGILIGRDGAVPSGSGVTNLIDSIVHMLIAYYVSYILRNDVKVTTQGDDGVWKFKRMWALDEVTQLVESLGMVLSSDKGGVSTTEVYFLQNIHSLEYRIDGQCVGIRPILRVLNGMLSYERLSTPWTKYDDTIRWIQQVESAKYHPKFSLLVNLLYERDKYARSLSISEIVRRGGGLGRIERDLKQEGFPYGKAALSGIAQFATVRELSMLQSTGRRLQKSVA